MILLIDDQKNRQMEHFRSRYLEEEPYKYLVTRVYSSGDSLPPIDQINCVLFHKSIQNGNFASFLEDAIDRGIPSVVFSNGESGVRIDKANGTLEWNRIVNMNAGVFYTNLRRFLDVYEKNRLIDLTVFHATWKREQVGHRKDQVLEPVFTKGKGEILTVEYLNNGGMNLLESLYKEANLDKESLHTLLDDIEDERLTVESFRQIIRKVTL